MKPPELHVRALGVELPADRASVEDAVAAGRCRREELLGGDLVGLAVAEGATGIELAVRAGRRALAAAGQAPKDTGLLLHASMLPEGPTGWSAAGYVLRELGCGPTVGHEVRQGCNGIFAAIELAAGHLALADPGADTTALVTTALRAGNGALNRWRGAGFGLALGDAGAAVLLGRGPGPGGVARVDAVNSLMFPDLEGLHRGASAPSERDALEPSIDLASRSREFLAQAGYDMFDLHRMLGELYAEVIERSLAEAGIGAGDLARVLFTHSGRAATDGYVMSRLGLPIARAAWEFGCTVGHLGAGDQVVTLDHLIRTEQVRAGDRLLLVGGTQGYNTASAVLTVSGATSE